ncbi:acetyl-CoA synthetase-like protein [Dichomitus squalens]|nr:acetyl-CoA synthetase-like protein [Dichomitus squalens]
MTSAPSTYQSPRSLLMSGVLTLPELYEWQARENPDYPYFRFNDGRKSNDISFLQTACAIRQAARYVWSQVATPRRVAILASSDTITYIVTTLGVFRAGYTAFLISTRNVPMAIVDMLRRTGCKDVLVSPDTTTQNLAKAVQDEWDEVSVLPMPIYEELFPDGLPPVLDGDGGLPTVYNMDAEVLILHSSGTTNHPKPVPWTHRRCISVAVTPWYGELDLTHGTLSVHGMPMFHGYGAMMFIFAVANGMTLTTFPPTSPPTIVTPDNAFDGIVQTSSEYVATAPVLLELWACDRKKIDHMKSMKGVMFSGAPLNQAIGNALELKGVNLLLTYGCSELGTIARAYSDRSKTSWDYFELHPVHETVLSDAGDGKYELIIMSPLDQPFAVVNRKIGGRDAYATSDVLEPHPTLKGWWRHHGRVDDQILLSNGEKTNPTPIEYIIRQDPHVNNCLVFGAGRFQNGVIVDPKPEYKFDPQDTEKLQQFRTRIWKTIERANEFAPQHSRIFKEMIIVSSPSKPFTYGIKGFPRRNEILKNYDDEINELYAVNVENVQPFLQIAVGRVLGKTLPEDADLFRNGCDSLQATWIRNTIIHAVRQYSAYAVQKLPANLVFQFPTIRSLTDAILSTINNATPAVPISTAEELLSITERYSSNFPQRPSQLRPRSSRFDVVLITGTTRGFGCDVLEQLLCDEGVATVYAFNRPSSDATKRQHASFRERGLQEYLLSSSKFRMVEATLEVSGFGLAPELLEEIRNSVTHIIHNAWTVNFALTLPSFEPDLKAVRNLVDLALSSPYVTPPTIQLASSIGIFEHCAIKPPIPETPVEPASAIGSGYTESKWIAERVLYNAAKRANLSATVVRVGQLSGNKAGHWNEREWFPALVKSSLFTRCLPDLQGTISFIPGYPAAGAFGEMRNSSEPIIHLIHPSPVPWHDLIAPIAEELGVSLTSYSAWLSALESTAGTDGLPSAVEAVRENPALQLLDFFRSRNSTRDDKEPLGLPFLSVENGLAASKTLASMQPLSDGDATAWVAAWRASGFLPSSS